MNTQQTNIATPVGLYRLPLQHAADDPQRAEFIEALLRRIRERKGGKK
jgi:hypothetical protein